MLFGTTTKFGLECLIQKTDGKYSFGRLCFWAVGHPIGYMNQYVVLDVFISFIQRWIAQRREEMFECNHEHADTVLRMIYKMVYESVGSYSELVKFERRYKRYVLCPGGGASFDGVFAVVLPVGGRKD